ncbi:MAG TPA: 2-octaprenyl-6-methoxyphenyl hydroxylase [Pseudomonadales bacterium]|jgi:2-polyprenyl-6-methoxyphenol 4-hydroxylase|nr:2-octaprenyl-6-methoxyphenyl hydroxylase [Pseudomonadales bacterium]HNL91261.1 2-octaprenyl-6-methoxyphenyl hydroxylase [Pseudomonadales bacterium]
MGNTVDVAIVGGGMAGAALALLLARRVPTLSVAVVEQHALPVNVGDQLSLPSFDARSTALSFSTRNMLDEVQVWQALQHSAQPILQVHVSERQRPLGMLMRAEETGLPALGYVIENRVLGQVLLHAVRQQTRIVLHDNTQVHALALHADAAQLTMQTGSGAENMLRAKLVVVADGAQSRLRQQLGIAVDEQPYDQHALVANVVTELPHGAVAYERFTQDGPIALLPLLDCENQHRSALIWTLPDKQIEEIMQLPEAEFLQRVQEQLSNRCGRLLAVGARHSYPLVLVQAREQVRSRIVLMGSAAHHLHPVAGQGFNLIMRDCLALVDILAEVAAQQRDIGALAVLQQYLQQQQWDQQKTVTASDWLPRLFSNRYVPHTMLRSAALLGLDFLPGMREWFAREATGL